MFLFASLLSSAADLHGRIMRSKWRINGRPSTSTVPWSLEIHKAVRSTKLEVGKSEKPHWCERNHMITMTMSWHHLNMFNIFQSSLVMQDLVHQPHECHFNCFLTVCWLFFGSMSLKATSILCKWLNQDTVFDSSAGRKRKWGKTILATEFLVFGSWFVWFPFAACMVYLPAFQ